MCLVVPHATLNNASTVYHQCHRFAKLLMNLQVTAPTAMSRRRALQRSFSTSAMRDPGPPPLHVKRFVEASCSTNNPIKMWRLLTSDESPGHSTNGDGFSPRSPKKLLRVNCAGFATDPPRPGKMQQNLTIQVVFLNLLPEGVDLMIEVFELFWLLSPLLQSGEFTLDIRM